MLLEFEVQSVPGRVHTVLEVDIDVRVQLVPGWSWVQVMFSIWYYVSASVQGVFHVQVVLGACWVRHGLRTQYR